MNKLDRSPFDDATYQISRLCFFWLSTRGCYPIYTCIKHMTTEVEPYMEEHTLNKLGRGLLDDTTYQLLRLYCMPCCFREEDILSFHFFENIFSLCDLNMLRTETI